MRNNKFLATVLATQVGVFGVLPVNNTFAKNKKSEPGIISTLASRTVDFAYDLANGVLKFSGGITFALITGEFGVAVHNNISHRDHYSKYALGQAGIVGIDVASYENGKKSTEINGLFHVWCENTYRIKPVKVVGFDYPGLYEYNGHYYILIGNYGVNLGTVKTEAINAFKDMWTKTKIVAGEAKDFCVDKAKKIYNALTQNDDNGKK